MALAQTQLQGLRNKILIRNEDCSEILKVQLVVDKPIHAASQNQENVGSYMYAGQAFHLDAVSTATIRQRVTKPLVGHLFLSSELCIITSETCPILNTLLPSFLDHQSHKFCFQMVRLDRAENLRLFNPTSFTNKETQA